MLSKKNFFLNYFKDLRNLLLFEDQILKNLQNLHYHILVPYKHKIFLDFLAIQIHLYQDLW